MRCFIFLFIFSLTGIYTVKAQEFSDPSRTEVKNNAGEQGSKSGFFQANAPVNYPTGATGWWHLLDVRHTATINNFAMQFAGGFYDQELYFRKTSNNASQPWRRVLMENENGNVGIGTAQPQFSLDVTKPDQTYILIRSLNYTINPSVLTKKGGIIFNQENLDKSAAISFAIPPGYHVPGFLFSTKTAYNDPGPGTTDWYDRMFIHPNGNVGIGTITPTEKLAVNGKIRAKEIKVENANWPDYVFKDDYKLKPLSQVEAYIKEHQHLEDVPSADVVAKEGIELGANQAVLLKKIEELTLHLIEMEKNMTKQQKIIDKQAVEIDDLKSSKNKFYIKPTMSL